MHKLLGHRIPTHRYVAGGHTLGENNDVRNDTKHGLGREPVAKAAESGDNLIGNVSDTVALDQLPNSDGGNLLAVQSRRR